MKQRSPLSQESGIFVFEEHLSCIIKDERGYIVGAVRKVKWRVERRMEIKDEIDGYSTR